MMRLPDSLAAWGSPAFEETFKREVRQLGAAALPLQQGLSMTSAVAGDTFSVRVIGARGDAAALHVRAGIFYAGIIGGCSCADDPTPIEDQPEYCELLFDINRMNGETTVSLLPD
jgi:hypothetical protein